MRHPLLLILVAAAGLSLAPPAALATEPAAEILAGQALFLRHCAGCHGVEGAGDGPARGWLVSPPRDLRDSFLQAHPADELVDRLRTGESLRIELDPGSLRRRAADTAAVVAYLERLPDVDWPRVERGWEIYLHRCETCHGPYGAPPPERPEGVEPVRDLSASSFQSEISDRELLTAVRHGRHGMPALHPQVGSDEGLALVDFVRHLSPGFAIYEQTCAQCHGAHGRGAGSFVESQPLPVVAFDTAYFARVDRDDLRIKAWHMLDEHRPRMPHFRERLSRDQARQIVRYLQSRPAATVTPTRPRP